MTRIAPEQVRHEINSEATSRQLILGTKLIGKIPVGVVQPKVTNVEFWQTQNTGAVLITNFLDGQDGQSLYLLGDGFTSLDYTTMDVGIANLLLTNGLIYHLVRMNDRWHLVTGI